MKTKIALFLFILFMLFEMTANASSAPYKSYVYDANGEKSPAPDAFVYEQTIDVTDLIDENGEYLDRLYEPMDICVDSENRVYIADTKNNRIIILNSDFSLLKILTGYIDTIDKIEDWETGEMIHGFRNFYEPQGVFANIEKGKITIYICDTENRSIVQLDDEYKLIRKIQRGEVKGKGMYSEVLDRDAGSGTDLGEDEDDLEYIFLPTRVALDSVGRIYVIAKNFNLGVLALDTEGNYIEAIGAPKVKVSPFELFWRMLATKEQRKRMVDFVPTEYNNIAVDSEGFIYACSSIYKSFSDFDSLRRLNSKGIDVLKKQTGYRPYGDATYLIGKSPKIEAVMTLDNGIYAIMDRENCRVFFYDSDGANLFSLGTPADKSNPENTAYINGTLVQPVAIAWKDGKCLVLDYSLRAIVVYRPTAYGEKIFEATRLRSESKYEEEAVLWAEILTLNNNSSLAKQKLGKVAYIESRYEDAMEYFKSTLDTDSYSMAFKYYRRDIITKYFTLGVGIIIGLVVLIKILKKLRKKYLPPTDPHSYLGHLKFSMKIMTRPIHSYWSLCRENNSSVKSATTILIFAAFMSMILSRFTGFIFSPRADMTNFVAEFATVILPALLFVVCNWCVTSLMEGEAGLKQIYIGTCYAFTPLIIFYPFAILFSNIMLKDEGDFYSVFISIAYFYMLYLIFAGNLRMHDYTIGKTVWVLFITVVVMLIVVFLAILFFALMQQIYGFIKDIMTEIYVRS